MRSLLTAIAALAIATPAWAANDETPQPTYSADGVDWTGFSLCRRTNGVPDICMMAHSLEGEARRWAELTLDVCEQGRDRWQPVECAASRAYIKQRWGY